MNTGMTLAGRAGLPEFPSQTGYFPSQVVLAGVGKNANVPHATSHFQGLQRFFQRGRHAIRTFRRATMPEHNLPFELLTSLLKQVP